MPWGSNKLLKEFTTINYRYDEIYYPKIFSLFTTGEQVMQLH